MRQTEAGTDCCPGVYVSLMADVFISYATEDSHRATEAAGSPGGLGNLGVGENQGSKREASLPPKSRTNSRAKCVLILWSHHSARSMWVRDQAIAGRERGALLPVLIEPLDARQGGASRVP